MSQLRDLQKELKELLFLRQSTPPSSKLWKEGVPDRLRVYRNNVQSNWTDTLDYDFPLTKNQFSDEEWDALRTRFFEKNPPHHWELNKSVQPFPKFLSAEKIKPYIKELADWEWHDLQIFIDRSPVRAGSGSNPTTVVRVYHHQMFQWVEDGAPAERPPEQKPEVLVFYRDAKHTCHIREADPLMLLVLEHFKSKNAALGDLEPIRQKLLPGNRVPLQNVVESMRKDGLLL